MNEKYSLSNYIESDFNKEAIKACMFAINGSSEFNPIYISSLSGLGKTHLLKGVQLEFEKEKKKQYMSIQWNLQEIFQPIWLKIINWKFQN
ncbi:DnaA ATPase domain-containing protein [Mycoplasmopsis anatis]|uniref:DnaA ATPase domain-containing protein n=1 Tax=Mycoplasmopsis anatis TaxID=171279 RepID=UPI00101B8760|nr:DnaA/Hda family protein [Mycoplasmopsis anatis]